MKVLFLEPFYGGSHRDFAEGFAAHSRHEVDLVTLPSRFWKWRMRGAALAFAEEVKNPHRYGCLMLSGLMSLSDLKAIWGRRCPPAIVYFHENQLSYPLAPGEQMDYQFGFTNITTCVAADRVLFNSRFHMEAFLGTLPRFLKMMPDCRPGWVVEHIRNKSAVLHPGCRFSSDPVGFKIADTTEPPLVIWNHRWEFDKVPWAFFDALESVSSLGVDFRIALLGERFEKVPEAFRQAQQKLGGRIVHHGFVSSKEEYFDWLRRGTVVVGTAIQENFGISIVEAVRFGCLPLVPHRLVYPEVIPEPYHATCLYKSREELVEKLASVLRDPLSYKGIRENLSSAMARHAWEIVIDPYDEEIERLVQKSDRS